METQERLAGRGLLASIVDDSEDAIVSKDLDGTITSWNKGAERIFGYKAEEVIGRSVSLLIPQDRIDEEQGILDRIKHGERVEPYETMRRRKDGSYVEVSLRVSPLRDASGKVVGASEGRTGHQRAATRAGAAAKK